MCILIMCTLTVKFEKSAPRSCVPILSRMHEVLQRCSAASCKMFKCLGYGYSVYQQNLTFEYQCSHAARDLVAVEV